jgi:hypothetical protein
LILLDFSLLRLEFGEGGRGSVNPLVQQPRLWRGKKGSVNPLVQQPPTLEREKMIFF